MKKEQQNCEGDKNAADYDVKQVLRDLLDHSGDTARILEAYYWSTESELAEFVRQFLKLPDSTRRTLMAFMSMTKEAGQSVAVAIGLNGELTLTSPAVTDAMKIKAATSNLRDSSESVH
jgi:hypothetical protein